METVHSKDGTTIGYDRYGSGPAVVLVPGAIQHRQIDSQTATLATLLAPHFTVLHYDRRGRGDSTDTAPWSIDREVEDIAALIGTVGGTAMLYGMSSGGALVLHAAAAGLPVPKVAIYEVPFAAGDALGDSLLVEVRDALDDKRPGDAVAAFMTRAGGAPPEAVAHMRGTPIWPTFEAIAPTLLYDLTLTGHGLPPAELLSRVRVETLTIDGGASPPWAATAADSVASGVPDGHRRTLPDQTHMVDPTVLAPVLIDFFSTP